MVKLKNIRNRMLKWAKKCTDLRSKLMVDRWRSLMIGLS